MLDFNGFGRSEARVRNAPIADIAITSVKHGVTRFYLASFWAALIFAGVMALLPQPPQLPAIPSDKVQHIIAFATLAGLAAAAYPSSSLMRLLATLSVYGALIEILQAIPTLHRDSDPVDWAADTVASALVLGAVWWWRKRQADRRG